jgi:hypothetical protein
MCKGEKQRKGSFMGHFHFSYLENVNDLQSLSFNNAGQGETAIENC